MLSRRHSLVLGLPLLGLAALPFFLDGRAGPADEPGTGVLATVERATFDVFVRAIGELEPARSTMVSSTVRGDRGKIIYLIPDGTEVRAGDVLVRLDPSTFEEEARGAELEVRQLESLVEKHEQMLAWEEAQAERAVRTAEFDLRVGVLEKHRFERGEGPLELARLEGELTEVEEEFQNQTGFLEELSALREQGYVNDAEVQQVQKAVRRAQRANDSLKSQLESYRDFILPSRVAALEAAVERADMDLEQSRVSTGFKIGEARAALERTRRELEGARQRLATAQSELERTTIHAPLSGMVVHRAEFRDGERRKPRVGDAVWQNQPLLYLPDLSEMRVDTRVREVDLQRVLPGNRALLRVDAWPDVELEGSVEAIGILAERRDESERGEKYFRLSVRLAPTELALRPGMTARVRLHSAHVEDQLTVPLQALWEDDEGPFCYVARGERFERRAVQPGATDAHRVAILAGLAAGERVSLVRPDPERLLAGAK